MSTNLLLIDLSSIAHAMFYTSGNDADQNATSTKTVERVRALASGQQHVAICCDAPPYFRMDISADYKAKRDKDNNAVISHQIALAADILKADGFPVWSVKGFEADDLIASATDRAGDTDTAVTIASADKDLLQLVSDRVSIKSLKDGNLIGPDEVQAKFGVAPHQIRDYLSLVGDSSDNIKGATGIGAKRAVELLNAYGNLEDLFKALDEHPSDFTNSMIANLREFQPRMATVRELITLRTDVPLPFDEIFNERVPVDVAVFGDEEMTDEHAGELRQDAREDGAARSAAAVIAPAITAAGRAGPLVDPAPVVHPAWQAPIQRDGSDAARSRPSEERQTLIPYVAPAAPVEWERQLEPRSMNDAKMVAIDLFASRMFSAYGNSCAVLSTIMAGRELGFQTMASLRAFHIIDGKPSLSAGAIHSLVLTSGKADYFRCTHRGPESATFVTKRKGDDGETVLTFTIAEARQAWAKDQKAWDASGWGKSPSDMLVARAITKLARLVYPDVCHGLYSPEEIQ